MQSDENLIQGCSVTVKEIKQRGHHMELNASHKKGKRVSQEFQSNRGKKEKERLKIELY